MTREMLEGLRDIETENIVWGVYIFIVVAALISNKIESDYIVTHSKKEYEEFHKINLIIFSIGFFIYVYFLYRGIKNYNKKRDVTSYISLIASTIFLVGGVLFLFVEAMGTMEVEDPIAF